MLVRAHAATFGICDGGNADYVCVKESDTVARIPEGVPYAEAAALADGGLSALSLLCSAGLRAGDTVLLYGALAGLG